MMKQTISKEQVLESNMKSMEKSLRWLHDINYFLRYLPNEYNYDIQEIEKIIKILRQKCIDEVDAPLIALKNYTEGKVSWERAGEICDLHIFGLRNYCEERNVDYGDLRIDEYYGLEGEEGIQKITENWRKLDPDGELQPINYSGDSLFTKYGLTDKSSKEYDLEDATENYINNKAKMLISEYVYEFYKTINMLIQDNPVLEMESEYFITEPMRSYLKRLVNGLEITTEEEYNFLKLKVDISKIYLKDSIKSNSLEQVVYSYEKIKNVMIDKYYSFGIDMEKDLTLESGYAFKEMIENAPINKKGED